MYEEYEYKSLKERMEECEDSFIDALFDCPLLNNGHKNNEKDIVDIPSIKIDEEDVLPF